MLRAIDRCRHSLHATLSLRKTFPGPRHRQGARRQPAWRRLPAGRRGDGDLVHRPSAGNRPAGRLRPALQALGAGRPADRAGALEDAGQAEDRQPVQGGQAPARRMQRTGDRHRRRPRRRDDRPRAGRALPLSRADPPVMAVGAGRRLDPQGAGRAQARRRDLQPLPRRPWPLACRLADRHEHEPAVHPARPPVRLPGRVAGGPGTDADAAPGSRPRPQHRRLHPGAVLGHRCAVARRWHRLHRAVAGAG